MNTQDRQRGKRPKGDVRRRMVGGHGRKRRIAALWLVLAVFAGPGAVTAARAEAPSGTPLLHGQVWHDRDGDGRRDRGEPGVPGVAVSNGRDLVRTDARGDYRLPVRAGDTVFAVKPPGWRLPEGDPTRPRFWIQIPLQSPGDLRYGGLPSGPKPSRFDLGLRRAAPRANGLDLLLFADPQVKTAAEVGHYGRDIVDSVLAERATTGARPDALGVTLGDIVDDVLSLYPMLDAQTARLGTPWLHAPGNHDIDFDVAQDAASLDSFRARYGPDSFAWEEPEASLVVLDDVIYRPGERPAYIGGFRDEQFAFLEAYLSQARRDRLLVIAVHIPLFEPEGRDTFRDADRARLFALLRDFPQVLILSGHSHAQRHHFHGPQTDWHGATPLHEYNVGAACGAYWTGVPDARGIPDATMEDGTPNGYARVHIAADGRYRLAWRVAGLVPESAEAAHPPARTHAMHLHAPASLRRGAYPAFGVFANVYMGHGDTRVEFRIDGGEWRPMTRVQRADPALLLENAADDLAPVPRGYDRSPEATVSAHLWRGTLSTDLAVGEHRVEVRVFDPWQGEQRASTVYRLFEVDAIGVDDERAR